MMRTGAEMRKRPGAAQFIHKNLCATSVESSLVPALIHLLINSLSSSIFKAKLKCIFIILLFSHRLLILKKVLEGHH